MSENFLIKIRSKKLRVTALLQALIEIMESTHKPLNILEIEDLLRAKKHTSNKTSLYRQVEKLTQIGILQENIFSDSLKRYCLTKEGQHHHHFYCKECGYTEELPIELCKKIRAIEKTFQSKKFKIIKHSIELEGLCPKCNL